MEVTHCTVKGTEAGDCFSIRFIEAINSIKISGFMVAELPLNLESISRIFI